MELRLGSNCQGALDQTGWLSYGNEAHGMGRGIRSAVAPKGWTREQKTVLDRTWSKISDRTLTSQILMGQKVTVVRCEEINISGSFFRNKLKYHAYLHSAYLLELVQDVADSQSDISSTPKSPVLSTTEHPPGSSTRPSEEW